MCARMTNGCCCFHRICLSCSLSKVKSNHVRNLCKACVCLLHLSCVLERVHYKWMHTGLQLWEKVCLSTWRAFCQLAVVSGARQWTNGCQLRKGDLEICTSRGCPEKAVPGCSTRSGSLKPMGPTYWDPSTALQQVSRTESLARAVTGAREASLLSWKKLVTSSSENKRSAGVENGLVRLKGGVIMQAFTFTFKCYNNNLKGKGDWQVPSKTLREGRKPWESKTTTLWKISWCVFTLNKTTSTAPHRNAHCAVAH